MAACCTSCAGKGYTVEATERGTTMFEGCAACQGTGGWNEIASTVTGGWAQHFFDAAERRRVAP